MSQNMFPKNILIITLMLKQYYIYNNPQFNNANAFIKHINLRMFENGNNIHHCGWFQNFANAIDALVGFS